MKRQGRCGKQYLQAFANLHGNSYQPLVKPKRTQSAVPTERSEQRMLVKWLRVNGILHFAIPNGGKRSDAERYSLVLEGLSPGVPDLCIPIARKPYHGLFLELKRQSGGVVSENQQYWLDQLAKQGYLAVVCKGFDAAKRLIEDYLKGISR